MRLELEVKLYYKHFESGKCLTNQIKCGNTFRYLTFTTCTSKGFLKIDTQSSLAGPVIMKIEV